MKNVSLTSKFLAIMALFGVFTLIVAVYATGEMQGIDRGYSSFNAHENTAALYLSRGNRALNSIEAGIANLLIARTDEDNRRYNADIAAARKNYDTFMSKASEVAASQGAQIDELRRRGLEVLDRDCALAIKQGAAATTDNTSLGSQATYLKECSPQFGPIVEAVHAAILQMVAQVERGGAELSRQTGTTVVATYAVVLAGLAAVLVGGFFAVRAWIAAPINGLAAIMGRLAKGELGAEVPDLDRRDEIGAMSQAVQVFKEAGIEKLRVEAEAADARAAAEAERVRHAELQAQAAAQQAQVVEGLASGLSRLAEGDLVQRLHEPFAPEYETLRADFNAAMDKLQSAMTEVSSKTAALRSGTGEISQASDNLSRRTEQQAASLEETAAALDQITATVKKTAEGSAHANKVVGAARTDAERSGEVVSRAVEAMGAIEASSRQIGQIIGVIDEIAFQTNLLALNAGVEAARAGDAGRGFAVVASEVRALAQRSAEAAKEIKSLIRASETQVNTGVELVSETGDALSRIVEQVTEINKIVAEIAASAQEQATGLVQVNTAVNQMDQVTQQNAAMVEEATAATNGLAQETEELGRLVGRFQVGGARTAEAEIKPLVRPRPKPAAKAPAPVGRAARRGAVVALREPDPATETWDEF